MGGLLQRRLGRDGEEGMAVAGTYLATGWVLLVEEIHLRYQMTETRILPVRFEVSSNSIVNHL